MIVMGNRRFARLAQFAAWLSIVAIAYFTMASVSVVYSIYQALSPWLMHPGIGNYAIVEHLIVFALFGAIFCIAYPTRTFMVCSIVLGSAIALELMQNLTADRHGTLPDALEKLIGGACGIFIAKSILNLRQRGFPRGASSKSPR
jgi:hypothetical protein